MKPIYLEFCGINSFSEKAQIDFKALLAGGVFGIFGDTGSGKSTILDSIHFALYGQIERASGSLNDCINYKSESAYVIFDFEITTDGERRSYRVQRERKRKNGATKAWLYRYTDEGKQSALAEGARDVNEALEKIIGLSFADFKMCIALPQGDFAALVKAATAERVKLVSRLFDLEKYGERLSKRVNEKYYDAEKEVNLVLAKMEQNEGGSAEIIQEKTEEIEAEKQALKLAEKAFEDAERAYEKATALEKEKNAYDALCERLREMENRLPVMLKKREDAERLPRAVMVADKARSVQENAREKKLAQEKAARAEEQRRQATELLQRTIEKQERAGWDEKIVELSLRVEKVRGAEADIEAEKTAKKLLDNSIKEYNELKNVCPWEDFDAEKEVLEKRLSELGEDDTLLDYLRHNCKELLLAETYEEVRADLQNLKEKYPELAQELDLLIEKYVLIDKKGTETFDLGKIQAAFKQVEQERKLLREKLQQLEKRKIAYASNEEKKKLLIEQGRIYRENHNLAKEKIAFVKDLGGLSELERSLENAKNAKTELLKEVEQVKEKANAFFAESEKQKGVYALHESMEKSLSEELKNALRVSGFQSVEEAEILVERLGNASAVMEECKRFFEKYDACKTQREETDVLKFVDYTENVAESARREKILAQEKKDELNRSIAAKETALQNLLELQKKYCELEKELTEKRKRKDLCDELRALTRNNRFLEFIASEYLQEICQSATRTLLSLTGGRYFLRYEKEFKVGDNLDGGNLRAVKTLSGGETFLVSLSLALSLSGAICQKSLRPIEFFFLDEGFGTLDEKLVDTVMDVLGKLSKSFAVGLISHVEELKHRIDNKILVTGANEQHGSLVKIERF